MNPLIDQLADAMGQARLGEVDRIISEIKASQAKPGIKPMTSNQLRLQADRRRAIATSARLMGMEVKPPYDI